MALIPSKAGLELLRSPSPDLAGRRSSRLQGIVEDVLREGGVLTTDEIYCGVKARPTAIPAPAEVAREG
jgi:hypothetical protein